MQIGLKDDIRSLLEAYKKYNATLNSCKDQDGIGVQLKRDKARYSLNNVEKALDAYSPLEIDAMTVIKLLTKYFASYGYKVRFQIKPVKKELVNQSDYDDDFAVMVTDQINLVVSKDGEEKTFSLFKMIRPMDANNKTTRQAFEGKKVMLLDLLLSQDKTQDSDLVGFHKGVEDIILDAYFKEFNLRQKQEKQQEKKSLIDRMLGIPELLKEIYYDFEMLVKREKEYKANQEANTLSLTPNDWSDFE